MYQSKIKQGILVFTVCTLLLSGCSASTEESSTEVTVGENQSIVYGVVTAIEGNEMTYTEVEESVVEKFLASNDTQTKDETERIEQSTEESGDSTRERKTPPNMSGEETEEMGTPPDRSREETEEMGTPPDRSGEETEEMGTPPDRSGEKMSGLTGESVTSQIPVGVVVHTASDTETTFSRIVAGDKLKILMETDEDGNQVIVEIWMLQ